MFEHTYFCALLLLNMGRLALNNASSMDRFNDFTML